MSLHLEYSPQDIALHKALGNYIVFRRKLVLYQDIRRLKIVALYDTHKH